MDDPDADGDTSVVVPTPLQTSLPSAVLRGADGTVNLQVLAGHFLMEGRLAPADALDVLRRGTALLRAEPNLLRIGPRGCEVTATRRAAASALAGDAAAASTGSDSEQEVVVVGDIHGQFHDLLKLLHLSRFFGHSAEPSAAGKTVQLLFLGDYVDRGSFSCETFLLLLALKMNHPTRVWLLRGNHESRHLTTLFNCRGECKAKYGPVVFEAMAAAFNALPLGAVVGGRVFCVHGGLSPELRFVADVDKLDRFREVPASGPMNDLLWADPAPADRPDAGPAPPSRVGDEIGHTPAFAPNTMRECSHFFAVTAVERFLRRNNLLCLVRAHEVQDDGFAVYSTPAGVPVLVSLFSAPNYCGCVGNVGAILRLRHIFAPRDAPPCPPSTSAATPQRSKPGAASGRSGSLGGVSPPPRRPSDADASPAPAETPVAPGATGGAGQPTRPTFSFVQFYAAPHPYTLPNGLDGFRWSFPHVVASLRSVLDAMLASSSSDDDGGGDDGVAETAAAESETKRAPAAIVPAKKAPRVAVS